MPNKANPLQGPMTSLRDLHTLEDVMRSGRFGRKAIKRLNEGIKKMQAQMIGSRANVNVSTLDNTGVLFKLCDSSTAPLAFTKTYDATEMTFIQQKSVVSVCDGCKLQMPVALLQTCTGCKIAVYCDKECQTAHWKRHKGACRMLRKGKSFLEEKVSL